MPIVQPPKRNLGPKNRRTVEVAQNTIQRVAPLAQEQYNNALRVNGYDAIIYNRLFNGRKCSCSKAAKVSPTVLDDDGNATQEHINTMLTGTRFGIKDYNVGTSENPNVFSFDQTQANTEVLQNENVNTMLPDLANPRVTTVIAEEDDYMLEPDLGSDMAGKCGVCYGNSYVGGYNVFNGSRTVLDTTFFTQPDLKIPYASSSDASILNTECPNKFELGDSGYIVFQTIIPKNTIALDSMRVFDNFQEVRRVRLEIKHPNDVSFVTLSPMNILNFATGLPVQLKVSGVSCFTHVELQFNLSEVIAYVEYPRLTKTGDLSVLDAIDGVSLVVGPLVPSVQPWDVIVDNVFKRAWRVTSSNWFNDRTMNIHGWDIQARLVQEYELQFNLPRRNSQKKVTTNFNR